MCSKVAKQCHIVIEKRVAWRAQQSVSVVTAGMVLTGYGGPAHAYLHHQCRYPDRQPAGTDSDERNRNRHHLARRVACRPAQRQAAAFLVEWPAWSRTIDQGRQ